MVHIIPHSDKCRYASICDRVFKRNLLVAFMLYILQVLQDVTAEEFQQFVDVLLQLRTMATRKGAQDLVDIVANQADLSSDFQVSTVTPAEVSIFLAKPNLARHICHTLSMKVSSNSLKVMNV